jgi:hypothetical protein
LGKISKQEFPKFDGDPSTFPSFQYRFIAALCASELAPLYDQANDSLVGYNFYINDSNFLQYEIQLYARLLQALPDSSTFIQSTEYRSRGVALWHALLEDNNSTGAVHNTYILLPAFYALRREQSESIDAYWNRFHAQLIKLRRDPNAPILSASHVRQQFLITLGGTEFAFLKNDWENSSLDEKWMNFTDGELKSALRLVQQASVSICFLALETQNSLSEPNQACSCHQAARRLQHFPIFPVQ